MDTIIRMLLTCKPDRKAAKIRISNSIRSLSNFYRSLFFTLAFLILVIQLGSYSEMANADNVVGTQKKDYILGNDGSDVISGEAGVDSIFGGPGDDRINGGSGDDYLVGNEGNDIMTGGRGADTFVCEGGVDEVRDFDPQEDAILGNCTI
jgi:Ca2+-binding RTX toxin-like protein